MCCRMGLEGLQEVVGTGMLPARALSLRSSLSALWGGGTGEWSGQSRCWRPWESSLCAACLAQASPHMPAMTAQLWENLSGLQGLSRAAQEGWRLSPGRSSAPLLFLLSVGTVRAAGVSMELGGVVVGAPPCLSPHWPFQTHPSEWGVGERHPFPSSVPALPPV